MPNIPFGNSTAFIKTGMSSSAEERTAPRHNFDVPNIPLGNLTAFIAPDGIPDCRPNDPEFAFDLKEEDDIDGQASDDKVNNYAMHCSGKQSAKKKAQTQPETAMNSTIASSNKYEGEEHSQANPNVESQHVKTRVNNNLDSTCLKNVPDNNHDLACLKSVTNLDSACLKSVTNLDSACLKSATNLDLVCLKSMTNLDSACLKSVTNLDSARLKSATNLDSTCLKRKINLDSTCLKSVKPSSSKMIVHSEISLHFCKDCKKFREGEWEQL
jgi:hypothetical protein